MAGAAVALLIGYIVLLQAGQGVIFAHKADAHRAVAIHRPEGRGLVFQPTFHRKAVPFQQIFQHGGRTVFLAAEFRYTVDGIGTGGKFRAVFFQPVNNLLFTVVFHGKRSSQRGTSIPRCRHSAWAQASLSCWVSFTFHR